jgi:hypothetical protein
VAAGRWTLDAYATTPARNSFSLLQIPNLYIPDRLHDSAKLRFLPGGQNRLLGELFFCFHHTSIV